jgi:hypothetical protein
VARTRRQEKTTTKRTQTCANLWKSASASRRKKMPRSRAPSFSGGPASAATAASGSTPSGGLKTPTKVGARPEHLDQNAPCLATTSRDKSSLKVGARTEHPNPRAPCSATTLREKSSTNVVVRPEHPNPKATVFNMWLVPGRKQRWRKSSLELKLPRGGMGSRGSNPPGKLRQSLSPKAYCWRK